jgi:hypothetical protein
MPSTALRRRNIAFIFMEFPYNKVDIVGQTHAPVKRARQRRRTALRSGQQEAERKDLKG